MVFHFQFTSTQMKTQAILYFSEILRQWLHLEIRLYQFMLQVFWAGSCRHVTCPPHTHTHTLDVIIFIYVPLYLFLEFAQPESGPFVVRTQSGVKVGEGVLEGGCRSFLLNRYFGKMALRSPGLAGVERCLVLLCALSWGLRGSPARAPSFLSLDLILISYCHWCMSRLPFL